MKDRAPSTIVHDVSSRRGYLGVNLFFTLLYNGQTLGATERTKAGPSETEGSEDIEGNSLETGDTEGVVLGLSGM